MNRVKKWILIVDDEPGIVEIEQDLLELHFGEMIKFVTAGDGIEATHKLTFQAFDLIITDLNMPKREGGAFIDAIKQSPLNQNAPVIVLTGNKHMVELDRYKHVHLIEKPINPTVFVSVVTAQLKLGKTDQRLEAGLLNSFVMGFTKFLKELMKIDVEPKPPYGKRKFDPVADEVIYRILVRSGKVETDFLFGFNKSVIDEMAKAVNPSGQTTNYKVIAGAAGGTILQHALSGLGGASGVEVLIQQSLFNEAAEDTATIKEISKKKGFTLPLSSDFGMINISALY